jgi:hypothetical protein
MFDLQHDYPSSALPYLPSSPAEQLAAHPDASAAATRIIAAAGQMTSIVQKPFLFLCDATMGVSLKSLSSQTVFFSLIIDASLVPVHTSLFSTLSTTFQRPCVSWNIYTL